MNTVFAIVGLAALTLTGCAGHTHALAPASGNPSVTVGTFSHEGREAPAMLLEVGGRRFTAQGFAIRRDVNRSVSQQHNSRGRRPSGYRLEAIPNTTTTRPIRNCAPRMARCCDAP
jgi:hypothetical protein